jgi:predicted RNA-binding protein YlqC (UPF0109 family)
MMNGSQREIHQMLLSVVRSLADSPDQVQVELISGEENALFRVEAAPSDVGRLIGKNGQTARALEAILNVDARRSGRRIHIEIDRRPDLGTQS